MKLSRKQLRKMILKEMYDSSYTHARVNSYSYQIASAIIEDCKDQGLETINIQDGQENAENILVYDYETEDTIAIIVSIDDDGDVELTNKITGEEYIFDPNKDLLSDAETLGDDYATKLGRSVVAKCQKLIFPMDYMSESLRRRKQRRIRR
jgi:hypothetical protein